jgi:hypothetical protein
MTNEELENLLVKSKIRFDDEDWIKKQFKSILILKKNFLKNILKMLKITISVYLS